MPFTLRNLREDLADVGSNFDGAPDLEFRLATDALELQKSGLSYQSAPPGRHSLADVDEWNSRVDMSIAIRRPDRPFAQASFAASRACARSA
jgi:hypothetical protein